MNVESRERLSLPGATELKKKLFSCLTLDYLKALSPPV